MTGTFAHIDLVGSAPLLVLSLGAVLMMLLEATLRRPWPRAELALLSLLGAAFAAFHFRADYAQSAVAFGGLMYVDTFTLFATMLILLGSVVAVLCSKDRMATQGIETVGDYFSLLLMSVIGALMFVSAGELITLFLGLEIMSLALYCLCGAALKHSKSSESALKYFILGSFSSAFLLYGIALLYGLSGSTTLAGISTNVADHLYNPLLYFAIGMMLVGFAFKVGAVPFHFWAPDVYQGAPTGVTIFMASVVKVAAFGAALRVMWSLFSMEALLPFWSDAVWVIAILTMTVGNLGALRQKSVKRMLAYSSVAHAGYMMVGFLTPKAGGGEAILFYLVTYSLMTIGAFALVLYLAGNERDGDDLSRFNGLAQTQPVVAATMALFLFSLAGLPPGFAGLLGKFYLFNSAVRADYVGLAIIGVLNSAVSCYYYLAPMVAMYFKEPASQAPRARQRMGFALSGSLALCALGSVVLGLFPSWLHGLTTWAARF